MTLRFADHFATSLCKHAIFCDIEKIVVTPTTIFSILTRRIYVDSVLCGFRPIFSHHDRGSFHDFESTLRRTYVEFVPDVGVGQFFSISQKIACLHKEVAKWSAKRSVVEIQKETVTPAGFDRERFVTDETSLQKLNRIFFSRYGKNQWSISIARRYIAIHRSISLHPQAWYREVIKGLNYFYQDTKSPSSS